VTGIVRNCPLTFDYLNLKQFNEVHTAFGSVKERRLAGNCWRRRGRRGV